MVYLVLQLLKHLILQNIILKKLAKSIFTKKQIIESGATSALDLLKKVSGLDYYQTGQKGQQAAIFMRGSESNHTLVIIKWHCNK